MDKLKDKMFAYFEEMSRIPRGSGNTDMIAEYLVAFAGSHDLRCRRDEANNVIIIKPASKGYENADPVMLQGHTDMVCEKTPDCTIDMEKEGLILERDGDWMSARGTTLGADDGIAVAMALAILDSDELGHPELQCLFTTDEETGMGGARALDLSHMTAKKLINIDSEEEGVFTVSCAGGVNAYVTIPIDRCEVGRKAVNITVGGLTGGHSGIMIHKERANSNQLMGRILSQLSSKHDIHLAGIHGGKVGNVICKSTEAVILINEDEYGEIAAEISELETVLRREFRDTDPELFINAAHAESAEGCDRSGDGCETTEPMTAESTEKIITWLMTAPEGIQNLSPVDGSVETSLNLGAVSTGPDSVTFTYAVRSSVAGRKELLKDRLIYLAKLLGGRVEFDGDYPGWEYLKDSSLRDTAIRVFTSQYGHEPEIVSIHAGLECGMIAEKIGDGFDAISIGPDLFDVHTPDERMSISSAEKTFKLLCGILEDML